MCSTGGGGDEEGQGSPGNRGVEMQVQADGSCRSCCEYTSNTRATHNGTGFECGRRCAAAEAAKTKPHVPGCCAAAAKGKSSSSSSSSPCTTSAPLHRKFIIITQYAGKNSFNAANAVVRPSRCDLKRKHCAQEALQRGYCDAACSQGFDAA